MKNFILLLSTVFSCPALAMIDWAGNFSYSINQAQIETLDPISIYQNDLIHFSVEVYQRGVTEAMGQGHHVSVRLYFDVPHGEYMMMKYVGDRNNNDLYEVEMKPWTMEASTYRIAIAVTDEDVSGIRHWSDANFYWVTQQSYGYTNCSYPNHEWIESFRTLKVNLRSRSNSSVPILQDK